MKKTRKTYKKPTIREKKIAISFFLTKIDFLDNLPFSVSEVYAQGSGAGDYGGCYVT